MGVKVKIEGVEGGLNSQTGKSDEIAIIEELHRKVSGSQTYMEHLFSLPFVEWIKSQIRDDLSCDIHSALVHGGMEVGRLTSIISNLEEKVRRGTEALEAEVSKWKFRWQEKENDDARHVQELADARKERQREQQEWIEKFQETTDMLEQEREDSMKLADQVVSLKAKLYDLMVKKTEGAL